MHNYITNGSDFLLISKTAQVAVNARNYKRFRALGYDFSQFGDIIDIKVEDLSPGSEVKIKVQCDYCGLEFEKQYCDYLHSIQNENYNGHDACKRCRTHKMAFTCQKKYGAPHYLGSDIGKMHVKQVMMEKYGVPNPTMLPEILAKVHKTNLERYGTEYPSTLSWVKEKTMLSNRSKYGVDYPMSLPEFQERRANTCTEKYGSPYAQQNEEIKDKIRQTCLERYGYANPSSSPEIREKVAKKKYERGSQTSSAQQRHICDLLKGQLNYPFRKYFIDVAFPDEKIAVEYNGSGHDLSVRMGQLTCSKFTQNETYRKKQLYQEGWRLITIISHSDELPDDHTLLTLTAFARGLLNERHWVEIDLDMSLVRTSQQTYPFEQLLICKSA